jgi:glycosyltransferase involved in cell wall biosynthesis
MPFLILFLHLTLTTNDHKMRIAIVHDDLMRRGGGEQVVLSMLRAYPTADLFTLCYKPELTYPEFKNYRIKTSLFNVIAKSERSMKMFFFPIGLLCMKFLKVSNYDVVIISNTYCAKYVSIDRKSIIFIYTHTPFRLAWNPTSYDQYNRSSGLKRIIFDNVISLLRNIDSKEAQKGNYFLSITNETVARVIEANYSSKVDIIHPPVKCNNFYVTTDKTSDYYLLVSRLEFYKKVDLAIRAFNTLGKRLVVVGNGSKSEELKAMANGNIEFKSSLSKEQLADLYANCKAFIFPQHEDYGITPLEANASGRPVIAYEKGGVLETMIPFSSLTPKNFTAIFFKDQTPACLIDAVELFETLPINSDFIRSHAEKFDESVFVQKFTTYVNTHIINV